MSDKYNEVKVFTLTTEYGVDGVYACRGVACNMVHQWSRRKQEGVRIEGGRLLFHDGDMPTGGELLCRGVDGARNSTKTTSWYFTEIEAQEAAERLRLTPSYVSDNGHKYYSIDRATFSAEEIEPQSDVVRVEFERDKNGRLFTRLNAHPERDGFIPQGQSKIFFPDKSFTLADVGEADVSVAKEFDTYGFLTGEMVKFEDKTLTESAILDWAWEKGYFVQELVTINHPARGRYYAMYDGKGYTPISQFYDYIEERNVVYADTVCYSDVVKQDAERYTESQDTFSQLFIEDVWGTEVDSGKVEEMFKPSKFFEATDGELPWNKSTKFHSTTIDAAVKGGVLSQYVLSGTHIEVVSYSYNVFALLTLSVDEAKSLSVEVSAINTKADEAANNLRRKGKLIW